MKHLLALALVSLALAACGRNAVRANEKEFLADRIMVFDSDTQDTQSDQHIQAEREGAVGGKGTQGGGCGCN